MESYLSLATASPLLTHEQEIDLGQRIAEGDMDARETMIRANLRLVVAIAKRYARRFRLPIVDLIQEGNIGLMRAVSRYNPANGSRFSTYATYWIKQAMRSAIGNDSLIRIPAHIRQKANESGITYSKKTQRTIAAALRAMRAEVTATMPDVAASEQNAGPDPDDVDRLQALLWRLSPRERDVVTHRFGLEGETPKTLAEVGLMIGATRERVRQIQCDAVEWLARWWDVGGVFRPNLFAECA